MHVNSPPPSQENGFQASCFWNGFSSVCPGKVGLLNRFLQKRGQNMELVPDYEGPRRVMGAANTCQSAFPHPLVSPRLTAAS